MFDSSLVSIIVPVYNVEKFLNRCVKSLVNQTYRNIEIILVDDGSTDASGQLCDEWKSLDDRILVIHKENSGISSARNAGLQVAAGEYISFVDSDDYVDDNMIDVLYNNILLYETDISVINYKSFSDKEMPKFCSKNKVKVLKGKDILRWALVRNNTYCSVRFLFPRKLLRGIVFDEEVKRGEDQKFNFQILSNARCIAISTYQGYFYFNNDNSISGGKLRPNHEFDLQCRQWIYNETTDVEIKKLAETHIYKGYLSFYIVAARYGSTCERDIILEYGKILRKKAAVLLFGKSVGFKRRLVIAAILFGDRFACMLIKKLV